MIGWAARGKVIPISKFSSKKENLCLNIWVSIGRLSQPAPRDGFEEPSVNKTAWMSIASLALAIGLSACKNNGAASTTTSGHVNAVGVPAPVTTTWRPTDKTADFLSAFRPQE
jgi:hypothetical protein